jgi:hypothetical protein
MGLVTIADLKSLVSVPMSTTHSNEVALIARIQQIIREEQTMDAITNWS